MRTKPYKRKPGQSITFKTIKELIEYLNKDNINYTIEISQHSVSCINSDIGDWRWNSKIKRWIII